MVSMLTLSVVDPLLEAQLGQTKDYTTIGICFFSIKHAVLKGNFTIFDMLAKYVPGDIKYIFTKFYRHISTNNEANHKFVILISNVSIRL